MTGPGYPHSIHWYKGHPLVQRLDQATQTHQADVRRIITTPTAPSHSYYTRQASSRRHHPTERYGPYRHRERRLRLQVRSRFVRQSMGGSVSKGMKQMKTDGNGNVERVPPTSPSESSQKLPIRLEMAMDQPPEEKVEQANHAWNPDDRSLNIFVKENDPFTFHRHPVAQSTDCIRGKQSYSSGLHVFEIYWPSRQRGTHAVVGVATKDAPLHSPGYQSLIGSSMHSWGWDLGRCKAYHNSDQEPGRSYPLHEQSYQAPDRFLMVLDMDLGTLSFVAKGKYLGVAHTGLRGKAVFPTVSSVWGHCEVTMKYLTWVSPGPTSLSAWCRRSIRLSLGHERIARGDIERLTLPTAIKEFLVYR